MDANSFHCQCDIDPVIDEELRPARGHHGLHLTRKGHEFLGWEITLTELNCRSPNGENPLQKGNQRTPVGLMAIRHYEQPGLKLWHKKTVGRQASLKACPRWDYWLWHTIFSEFVRPCMQADRHTPQISLPRPW